jgi:CheY-like chemotaxis protein
MNILVVEDSVIHVRLLEHTLRQAGYQPIVAQSGREAVRCLMRVPDLALILLDICLPELHGFTLLTILRAHPHWHTIPVIVTTGLADVMSVRKAAQMGVQRYLLKPFGVAQVRQAIHEVLQPLHPSPALDGVVTEDALAAGEDAAVPGAAVSQGDARPACGNEPPPIV